MSLAIVGGGVTGVAAFLAAVRHRISSHIDIVDPLPPGTGTAFAHDHPDLLCNTSAGIMSLVPGSPNDFVRHLRARRLDVTGDDFVPRACFRAYLRTRYTQAAALHRARGGSHAHLRDRAVAVHRATRGRGYRVVLADGRATTATHVLVCTGYGTPVVPDVLAPHLDHPLAFRTPFPEGPLLRAMPPRARVLVLGTRLSGIDAALLLCGQGHRVTMASPSGRLPAVRTRTGRGHARLVAPADIARLDLTGSTLHRGVLSLVRKATSTFSSRPLREQLANGSDPITLLRHEIRLAEQGHTDWQDVVCSFVDAANEALTPLDQSVRDTALRRCEHLFSRYLAAFPLGSARKLLAHHTSGFLLVRAGTPAELRPGKNWSARWPDGTTSTFDAVVGAAGYHPSGLHAEPDTLYLPERPGSVPTLLPDLRVVLPGARHPERIHLLGLCSAPRVPSISAVYPMVQQVEHVTTVGRTR